MITRRAFLDQAVRGSAVLALTPVLGQHLLAEKKGQRGPATRIMRLDGDWLFGGNFDAAAMAPGFNDGGFMRVDLPHCVTPLSWQDWKPESWEKVWMYRRHFRLPKEFRGLRVFLQFDGVMVGATPHVNGHAMAAHLGGYLPFEYEIGSALQGENVLAVEVDSRWSDVPPEGSAKGPVRVDYLEPGGIYRPVRLKAVPHVFIRDVFAKPVQVLDASRRVDVICTLDADPAPNGKVEVEAALEDGGRVLARTRQAVQLGEAGKTEVKLSLAGLGNVELWDVDHPRLYEMITTLLVDGRPVHDYRVRFGFRDARFEMNGFYLNGRRLQIFGLNRHQYYPYVGGAMPARVQRKDAEILRHEMNCNMVRCSHYPQSEDFLDACDELGMMVWEETPGWGYLGDAPWKELLVRDVGEMIVRDRNHPSIVIWGVRANESANDVELYRRTTALAKSLDDSRPDSGSMTPGSRKNWKETWHEDVFAYDDYHSEPDGTVGIEEPVEGVPYFLTEAVGQFSYPEHKGFHNIYRRGGDLGIQVQQAIWHAQAHSRAANNPRICGVIAWCGFEYPSLVNPYRAVKYPGVCDLFRIPKLGSTFYRAQGDPQDGAAIEPNFYWDFGAQSPHGPGKHVAIFSTCDRLEIFVDGKAHATLEPDTANYAHLKHAPFFTDLEFADARPEVLRIDGYARGKLVLTRSFSADHSRDRFECEADDAEIAGDGSDATRVVCRVVDHFGANRAFGEGTVQFELKGPGVVVGDNPLNLTEAGGAAAVWIKGVAGKAGTIRVTARHSTLGVQTIEVRAGRPALTIDFN